jgi:hypothetical protein
MKRQPYKRNPERCECCGLTESAPLWPRWSTVGEKGLMVCQRCVDLSPRELAEVYCRRIERRDG